MTVENEAALSIRVCLSDYWSILITFSVVVIPGGVDEPSNSEQMFPRAKTII